MNKLQRITGDLETARTGIGKLYSALRAIGGLAMADGELNAFGKVSTFDFLKSEDFSNLIEILADKLEAEHHLLDSCTEELGDLVMK